MGFNTFSFTHHPKGVCLKNQEEGEEILLLLRQHPITNLSWIVVSVLALILPIIISYLFFQFNLSLDLLIPAVFQPLFFVTYYMLILAFIHLSFMSWYFNAYIVTNHRIIDLDYWGFLFFHVSATTIDHVEDVTYSVKGGLGFLFNFGDVFIQTAGAETNFDFLRVPDPSKVANTIMTLVKEHRKKI